MIINRKLFSNVLKHAIAHASRDTTRPHLCGVHFSGVGNRLQIQAMDSHRILRVDVIAPESVEGVEEVFISYDHAKALLACLKVGPDEISVLVGPNGVSSCGYTAAPSSERFPPTTRIIPDASNGPTCAVHANPGCLIDALTAFKALGARVRIQSGAGPLDPIRLSGETPDASIVVIVMPMRP